MAMTEETTDLAGALSPLLEARGLDLVDVELQGKQLTVFVDREDGVNLDELGEATKDVSAALDEIDPIPGRYTLSVSSPGLERRLRTPAHFARAAGEKITVRINGGTTEVRRLTGTLEDADDSGFTLRGPEVPDGEIRLAYDDSERARTVFEWGPQPKSSPSKNSAAKNAQPKSPQPKRAKSEEVKRP
jgi:ribosome maturation factor RimP